VGFALVEFDKQRTIVSAFCRYTHQHCASKSRVTIQQFSYRGVPSVPFCPTMWTVARKRRQREVKVHPETGTGTDTKLPLFGKDLKHKFFVIK